MVRAMADIILVLIIITQVSSARLANCVPGKEYSPWPGRKDFDHDSAETMPVLSPEMRESLDGPVLELHLEIYHIP
jgi:hypothetical protein